MANICLRTLNSETFKVNSCDGDDNSECQNMCNILPNIYGNKNGYINRIIYYNILYFPCCDKISDTTKL